MGTVSPINLSLNRNQRAAQLRTIKKLEKVVFFWSLYILFCNKLLQKANDLKVRISRLALT